MKLATLLDAVRLLQLVRSHSSRARIDAAATAGGRAVEYMKVLDGYVGKLMDQSGEETTTIVMSDHGFGPCKKAIEVNNLLYELGYLKYSTPDLKQERPRSSKNSMKPAIKSDLVNNT